MAHKVQKIFEWFKQFNKIDIKTRLLAKPPSMYGYHKRIK